MQAGAGYDPVEAEGRIRLVHFTENQYSWDDPLKLVNCYNAGLKAATGDYVWYQADDDWIADDYAEKMVRLFTENPECTTAAGLPVNVDIRGISSIRTPTEGFPPEVYPREGACLGLPEGRH